MKDDDEVTYILSVNEEMTEFTLVIKAPTKMSNADFVLALECYLSDTDRALKQFEKDPKLH